MNRRAALVAGACALGAAVLTGCGSSAAAGATAAATHSAAASSGMPATATTIMIQDFRYEVPPSVRAGSTVRVMNMDGEAHTVTSDRAGSFAVTVPAGTTATFTAPASAGRYAFHCDYHADMHATLVVR